ncbi:hypothetical protein GCM10011534_38480 [Pseudooceanicola nanhaiensis]|uniref:Uncharacterized protein n=1 Tax=Pseudooceanicola nanhaiensis TaxID=375761 RepID=A0A917WLC3_9RHOB|nr:hypothetical protein GCM10011534_38480 [Pseudooceanicola nanhaiensis]
MGKVELAIQDHRGPDEPDEAHDEDGHQEGGGRKHKRGAGGSGHGGKLRIGVGPTACVSAPSMRWQKAAPSRNGAAGSGQRLASIWSISATVSF